MDGPPGTGKSQTIANVIGTLLHAGKTVLFVSEKAAALDVVRTRLDKAGLGHFVLELHSQKATRKEVATALGKALDNQPVPPASMPSASLAAARARRDQLNDYADAMNRDRQPLGRSLHRVLGMIAQLHDVPAAPTTGRPPLDLTIEAFEEIRREARLLASAWRPALQGNSFIWRGVTEQGSLDSHLYQAKSALQALQGMVHINGDLARVSGLTRPTDAESLGALLEHLGSQPAGVPGEWLTADGLDSVGEATAAVSADLREIRDREAAATAAAGVPWQVIPQASALPAVPGLLGGLAIQRDLQAMTADEITALSVALASDATMLAARHRSLNAIAGMLGLQPPEEFNDVEAIVPCFMMSPLSVSQFLPPDLRFDVVIFDEASQVSPADAINCVYRGSALILAGDQKQLPPTSFFAAGVIDGDEEWSEDSDDTADFESVLDLAKSAGAFRSLTLRWHYRSRHEALIAFSNASFYGGKLVTFPSAHEDGPDVGVELFLVDGPTGGGHLAIIRWRPPRWRRG